MSDYGDFIQCRADDVEDYSEILMAQLKLTLKELMRDGKIAVNQMVSVGWKLKEL